MISACNNFLTFLSCYWLTIDVGGCYIDLLRVAVQMKLIIFNAGRKQRLILNVQQMMYLLPLHPERSHCPIQTVFWTNSEHEPFITTVPCLNSHRFPLDLCVWVDSVSQRICWLVSVLACIFSLLCFFWTTQISKHVYCGLLDMEKHNVYIFQNNKSGFRLAGAVSVDKYTPRSK